MTKARKYTKRIQFWQTVAVADGFGGSTVSETLVATSWAKITTPNQYHKLTEMGIIDVANSIIIHTRHREDIDYNAVNQYVIYRSVKYIVQNAPKNVDFKNVEIEIIATREVTESVTEL